MIRNSLTILLGVFALHATDTVAADDIVEQCARTASSGERIQCLEDAIRRLQGVPVAEVAEVVEDAAAAEPEPAAPAAERVRKTAEEVLVPLAEAAPAPVEPIETPAPAAADGGIDELGLEQVEARNTRQRDPEERITAEVVEFDFVGRQKLRVRLSNGQIWKQTNADRPNHYRALRNKEGFSVELWETGLGGYRMYIVDIGRTVRVERLK